jgi:hypothetical protein
VDQERYTSTLIVSMFGVGLIVEGTWAHCGHDVAKQNRRYDFLICLKYFRSWQPDL